MWPEVKVNFTKAKRYVEAKTLKTYFYSFKLCVFVCVYPHTCVCTRACMKCARECRYPSRPTEGDRFPGDGVVGVFESPDMGAGKST